MFGLGKYSCPNLYFSYTETIFLKYVCVVNLFSSVPDSWHFYETSESTFPFPDEVRKTMQNLFITCTLLLIPTRFFSNFPTQKPKIFTQFFSKFLEKSPIVPFIRATQNNALASPNYRSICSEAVCIKNSRVNKLRPLLRLFFWWPGGSGGRGDEFRIQNSLFRMK